MRVEERIDERTAAATAYISLGSGSFRVSTLSIFFCSHCKLDAAGDVKIRTNNAQEAYHRWLRSNSKNFIPLFPL